MRDELLVQTTLTEDSRGHIAFQVPKYAPAAITAQKASRT